MGVGNENGVGAGKQPNGRELGDRDAGEAPIPALSQRPVRRAGWGAPHSAFPHPDSFYFNYFTLETNLSKPGYLNHTAQAPTQAERCKA